MSLLDPRTWGLIAILVLAAYAGGRWHQWRADDAEQQLAISEAHSRAREIEDRWNVAARAAEELHDEELDAVRADLDAALQRVQSRPVHRLPPAATCTSDGAGATGAQLSGPDAEVLARLAADADRTAADLRACQTWAAAIKQAHKDRW